MRASTANVQAAAFRSLYCAQADGRIVRYMEDGNMKTLIIGSAATLALFLVAGPVLIQPALAESPNSVNVGGKNIGADPDSNVRFQIRRDVGSEGF